MKNLLKISFVMAILAITILGCKKDSDKQGGNNKPSVEMQNVVLQGIVTDDNDKPLGGVQVISGSTVVATTDPDGRFLITKVGVVNKRAVLKFEKSGYFTLTRSGVKQNEMFISAILHQKGNSSISVQKTFSSESATTLEVGDMKVAISASSIMRENGKEYNGPVKADMIYLDPDKENFSNMMPGGDLAGIRENGSESMLISYGMSNVTFTDNSGNPLQIKSGSKAKVSFPVPESMKVNPPKSMPLWSFDEDKGVWIEEGTFTLEGNVYVGEATHFSWINCDDPEPPADIWGYVVDCKGEPIPDVEVFCGQSSVRTNSKGLYSGKVPANTPITLSVTLFDDTKTQSFPGFPEGSKTQIPDFNMPCAVKIKGKVVDCDNRPIMSVKVSAGTTATYTNSSGEYLMMIPPNKPVTVKASLNGVSDSEQVPGQPEGTTYLVRDLKLCGGSTSEPGTYSKTEKGAMKLRFTGSDELIALTWDNNGMRFRMDDFDIDDDINSASAIIINHFAKTYISGSSSGTWESQPYDEKNNPFPLATIGAFSIDEAAWASMLTSETHNVAGKICKVFKISASGQTIKYSSWNGLVLRLELSGMEIWAAVSATIDVPEVAFTQTFNVSWLP